MNCPNCNVDTYPVQDLQDDFSVVSKCPKCFAKWPEPKLVTPQAANNLQVVSLPQSITVAGQLIQEVPSKLDIVALAKGRLAEIEKQLSEMSDLQAEANVLRQMLAAAKQTTKLRKSA